MWDGQGWLRAGDDGFFFLTVNQQARATDRKTYEKGWYLDLRSGKEKRNLEGKKLRDDDGWIRQGAGLAQLGILFFRLFSLFFPFAFFTCFPVFPFLLELAWLGIPWLFSSNTKTQAVGMGLGGIARARARLA